MKKVSRSFQAYSRYVPGQFHAFQEESRSFPDSKLLESLSMFFFPGWKNFIPGFFFQVLKITCKKTWKMRPQGLKTWN